MKTANAVPDRINTSNLQVPTTGQLVENDVTSLEIRDHEVFFLPKADEIWGVPTCCLDFNFQAI